MKYILIADDHVLVRKGLSMIIRSVVGQCKITLAQNGAEVLQHVQQHNFDLAVLDLNMPDTDTIALFRQIMTLQPQLRVLICSMGQERVFAIRYLKLGAAGYVEKSEDDDVLEKAITTVINGRKYFSADVLDQITISIQGKHTDNPFDRLTDHEFEIAMYLVKGMPVAEIALLTQLHASIVNIHQTRILEKIGAQDIIALNKLAHIHHIIG